MIEVVIVVGIILISAAIFILGWVVSLHTTIKVLTEEMQKNKALTHNGKDFVWSDIESINVVKNEQV